jgi:hypothetical protein
VTAVAAMPPVLSPSEASDHQEPYTTNLHTRGSAPAGGPQLPGPVQPVQLDHDQMAGWVPSGACTKFFTHAA